MRIVASLVLGGMVLLPQASGAQSLAAVPLPTLALEPAPDPSIWHGLSVGTEVVGVSGRGGGIGADVFAGYDRVFGNGLVVGFRGSTGYLPAGGNRALYRGFDFGVADVKVGYEMGRFTPFVTAGIGLARPHVGAGWGTPGADSLSEVLSGRGETRTLTRVGAGVDYAVTDNLTVGFAVGAVQAQGRVLP